MSAKPSSSDAEPTFKYEFTSEMSTLAEQFRKDPAAACFVFPSPPGDAKASFPWDAKATPAQGSVYKRKVHGPVFRAERKHKQTSQSDTKPQRKMGLALVPELSTSLEHLVDDNGTMHHAQLRNSGVHQFDGPAHKIDPHEATSYAAFKGGLLSQFAFEHSPYMVSLRRQDAVAYKARYFGGRLVKAEAEENSDIVRAVWKSHVDKPNDAVILVLPQQFLPPAEFARESLCIVERAMRDGDIDRLVAVLSRGFQLTPTPLGGQVDHEETQSVVTPAAAAAATATAAEATDETKTRAHTTQYKAFWNDMLVLLNERFNWLYGARYHFNVNKIVHDFCLTNVERALLLVLLDWLNGNVGGAETSILDRGRWLIKLAQDPLHFDSEHPKPWRDIWWTALQRQIANGTYQVPLFMAWQLMRASIDAGILPTHSFWRDLFLQDKVNEHMKCVTGLSLIAQAVATSEPHVLPLVPAYLLTLNNTAFGCGVARDLDWFRLIYYTSVVGIERMHAPELALIYQNMQSANRVYKEVMMDGLKHVLTTDTSSVVVSYLTFRELPPPISKKGNCSYCRKACLQLNRCTRCYQKGYCSTACGTADWRQQHKNECLSEANPAADMDPRPWPRSIFDGDRPV